MSCTKWSSDIIMSSIEFSDWILSERWQICGINEIFEHSNKKSDPGALIFNCDLENELFEEANPSTILRPMFIALLAIAAVLLTLGIVEDDTLYLKESNTCLTLSMTVQRLNIKEKNKKSI